MLSEMNPAWRFKMDNKLAINDLVPEDEGSHDLRLKKKR